MEKHRGNLEKQRVTFEERVQAGSSEAKARIKIVTKMWTFGS